MHLEHQLDIDAPVPTVWGLTENIEAWPAISPTMTRIVRVDSGPLHAGSQAKVKQPAQRETVWTVNEITPNRSFQWETKVMGVRMVAAHELTEVDGKTRNTLSLDLSGRGAGLLGKLVGKKALAAIQTENEGFKRAAEAAAAKPVSD